MAIHLIDATYLKVRRGGRIVSVAAIIAVCVNADGRRDAELVRKMICSFPRSSDPRARLGMTQDQFDVIELKRSLRQPRTGRAARTRNRDDDARVNRNGGVIALGPLGMSDVRITGTAALELREAGGQYSLPTMCIGVGKGWRLQFSVYKCTFLL